MFQMIKRDFYTSRLYISLAFLLIPFLYIMNAVNNVIVYFYAIFFFIFFPFNADFKNNVNKFVVSLPIARHKIVAGRYLFSLFSFLLLLIFHYFVDLLAFYELRYLSIERFTGIKIVAIIAIFSVAISVSIPLYYYFKSFMNALYVQIGIFTLCFFGFMFIISNPYIDISNITTHILNIINIQPYVILLLFSVVCLYSSYRLSAWLFMRKDV